MNVASKGMSVHCRKAHSEQHVVEWMADPKASQELRDLWLSHWSKVDSSLGSRLKAELAGRQVCLSCNTMQSSCVVHPA